MLALAAAAGLVNPHPPNMVMTTTSPPSLPPADAEIFSNVALHAACRQSSSPDNATCYHALNNDSSFAHTASEDQPWFLVDLGEPHFVDTVSVQNKLGMEADLRDFTIAVSNSSDRGSWPSRGRASTEEADAAAVHVEGRFQRRVSVSFGSVGRYVVLRRRHFGPLTLESLEVAGVPLRLVEPYSPLVEHSTGGDADADAGWWGPWAPEWWHTHKRPLPRRLSTPPTLPPPPAPTWGVGPCAPPSAPRAPHRPPGLPHRASGVLVAREASYETGGGHGHRHGCASLRCWSTVYATVLSVWLPLAALTLLLVGVLLRLRRRSRQPQPGAGFSKACRAEGRNAGWPAWPQRPPTSPSPSGNLPGRYGRILEPASQPPTQPQPSALGTVAAALRAAMLGGRSPPIVEAHAPSAAALATPPAAPSAAVVWSALGPPPSAHAGTEPRGAEPLPAAPLPPSLSNGSHGSSGSNGSNGSGGSGGSAAGGSSSGDSGAGITPHRSRAVETAASLGRSRRERKLGGRVGVGGRVGSGGKRPTVLRRTTRWVSNGERALSNGSPALSSGRQGRDPPSAAASQPAGSLVACPAPVAAAAAAAGSAPSLLVLFSVPLVAEDAEKKLWPLEAIDLEGEVSLLRRSIRESGNAVHTAFEVASVDNFRSLLTLGAFSCLHFSGHGHPTALAFEDSCGCAHFIDLGQLRSLMSAGDGQAGVRLVFVNCCYSLPTARRFVDVGIPHVIASPLKLRDAAAAAFTRALYLALAVGKSVGAAFEIAVESVRSTPRMPPGEAEKFVLLPEGDGHSETIWPRAPRIQSLITDGCSSQPSRPLLAPLGRTPPPAPPEDFVGRRVDMYAVLHALRRRRLVLLTAPAGLGKSSIAAAIATHQAMRRTYSDGVAFLSARSALAAASAGADGGGVLRAALCLELGLSTSLGTEDDGGDAAALETWLRQREALLVIDGVDDLVHSASFLRLIHSLLSHTLHLRLLLTSCRPLPRDAPLPVKVVTIALPPLPASDAARLLARRIGRPLGEVIGHTPTAAQGAAGAVAAGTPAAAAGAAPSLEALAAHPLMTRLHGHPGAINRAAAAVSERLAHLPASQALAHLAAELDEREAEAQSKP